MDKIAARIAAELGVGVAQVRLFEESLEQRYLEITEGATPSDVGVAG